MEECHNIPVTKKHISEGVKKSCKKCALALALKDYFGVREAYVSNNLFTAFTSLPNYQRIYTGMPLHNAQEFISDFDAYPKAFSKPTVVTVKLTSIKDEGISRPYQRV